MAESQVTRHEWCFQHAKLFLRELRQTLDQLRPHHALGPGVNS